MYVPVNIQNIQENPKYQTICGTHVTRVTKFLCHFSIVVFTIGLCLSSLLFFVFGIIITIPLIFAHYLTNKGIEELRADKILPVLVLWGINLVVSIALPIYVIISFIVEDWKYTSERRNYEMIFKCFALGIQLFWNSWCFVVINTLKN